MQRLEDAGLRERVVASEQRRALAADRVAQVLELQPVGIEALHLDALRRLLDREGIFAGVSSGAVVHVALKLAAELEEGAVVVTILPDGGWKYLSADFWDATDAEEAMEHGHWW